MATQAAAGSPGRQRVSGGLGQPWRCPRKCPPEVPRGVQAESRRRHGASPRCAGDSCARPALCSRLWTALRRLGISPGTGSQMFPPRRAKRPARGPVLKPLSVQKTPGFGAQRTQLSPTPFLMRHSPGPRGEVRRWPSQDLRCKAVLG